MVTLIFNFGAIDYINGIRKKPGERFGKLVRVPGLEAGYRNKRLLFCNECILFWFSWNVGIFWKMIWEEMKEVRHPDDGLAFKVAFITST